MNPAKTQSICGDPPSGMPENNGIFLAPPDLCVLDGDCREIFKQKLRNSM
jgi:hypothetical protein